MTLSPRDTPARPARQIRRVAPSLGAVLLGCLCLGLFLPARAQSNPFLEVIVTRNVFALKEPPPPPPPPDNTPPAPKLTLVGIANVLGARKAVIKTEPAPGAPPARAGVAGAPPGGPEPPLILTEGETREGVKVLAIDEAAGSVRVENQGQPLTLTLLEHGPKVPTGPAVAAAPPGVAPGRPGAPRPPGVPGVVTVPPGGAVTTLRPPTAPPPPVPSLPTTFPPGMTAEMQQRIAERYGLPPIPGQPVPTPTLPGTPSQ